MESTNEIRDHFQADSDRFKDQPCASIQWKGICVDLHCACGALLHVCGPEFLYAFICPHCDRHYEIGTHVAIYELNAAEIAEKLKAYSGAFTEIEPDEDRLAKALDPNR